MFGTLQAVVRVPRQLGDALQAATDAAQSLPALQRAVTERLASVDRGVRDTLAALRDVAGDLERVRSTIEPQHARVAAIESGLEVLPALAADLERVRATVEPQHARVASIESGVDALAGVAGEVERIRATIEPQHDRVESIQHAVARLEAQMAELQRTLRSVEGNVDEATELLPDPDAPGPVARAREAITGRS